MGQRLFSTPAEKNGATAEMLRMAPEFRVKTPPMDIIQPAHFPRPRGYANGTLTSGRLLHVAGQIGW